MASWLIPVEEQLSNSTRSSTNGTRATCEHSRNQDQLHGTTSAAPIKLHLFVSLVAVLLSGCGGGDGGTQPSQADTTDEVLVAQGKQIFRFDTFGDESQWTDVLRMHEPVDVTPKESVTSLPFPRDG